MVIVEQERIVKNPNPSITKIKRTNEYRIKKTPKDTQTLKKILVWSWIRNDLAPTPGTALIVRRSRELMMEGHIPFNFAFHVFCGSKPWVAVLGLCLEDCELKVVNGSLQLQAGEETPVGCEKFFIQAYLHSRATSLLGSWTQGCEFGWPASSSRFACRLRKNGLVGWINCKVDRKLARSVGSKGNDQWLDV